MEAFDSLKTFCNKNPKQAVIYAAIILAVVIGLLCLGSNLSSWETYDFPQAALAMRLPQAPVAVADTKIPGFSQWTMQNEDIALVIGAVKLTGKEKPAAALGSTIKYVRQGIQNNPNIEKADFKINQRQQGRTTVNYLTGTAIYKDGDAKANTYVEGLFHLTDASIGFVYAHYNTPKGEEILRDIFETVICK